jgi:hypothetical protein
MYFTYTPKTQKRGKEQHVGQPVAVVMLGGLSIRFMNRHLPP